MIKFIAHTIIEISYRKKNFQIKLLINYPSLNLEDSTQSLLATVKVIIAFDQQADLKTIGTTHLKNNLTIILGVYSYENNENNL